MNNINRIFILCFITMLCFNSCSKTGPAGPQGEQGEQGPQGQQGEQGVPGADGSTLFSGEGTPSADLGKVGDYYIDKSSSALFGPKTSSGWGNGIILRGPQGPKGEKGDQGDEGDKGNANVKTSGWRTFPTTFWEQGTTEHDGTKFYTLSDVDWVVNVNWFGLTQAEKEGVILLYVDDGHGVRLCPF